MKISSTSNNDQGRISFVENLYKTLRQETKVAMKDREHIVSMASSYLDDGVTESECVELLVIDGISRQAAESYVKLVQSHVPQGVGQHEYNFQFEDVYGKLWSSYDIHREVYASSDEEAWERAEEAIFSDPSIEPERIVSVDRMS